MARASLKFASDLLRRLGEELNPSPVNGIIELVKNSYDADAPRCSVTIVQPKTVGGKLVPGHLIIDDLGDGMTDKDFREGWLVLGRSRKSSSVPTKLGRRPVGDKGLGRLSALRMGRKVTVTSRPRKARGTELQLIIDWTRFDRSRTPNEVNLNIKTVSVPRSSHPGTTIRIDGIERKLEASEIERLNRGVLLVANPFEVAKEPFVVDLTIDPSPRRLLPKVPDLMKSAAFILEGEVASDGTMSACLRDGAGALLATAKPEDLESRFVRYGKDAQSAARMPAKFKLWIFLLVTSEFPGGLKDLNAVRGLLQEFGGVHVFLDGVRVAPYGDPNDDWAGMAGMRASNPEFMPQPRTAMGYVTLEDQPTLKQKTDRSGFLESPATEALRAFVRATLSWQSSVRIGFRDNAEQQVRQTGKVEREQISAQLNALFAGLQGGAREKAQSLVKRLGEVSSRQEAVLSREIELYRSLGTAGIAASVFAHESANNSLARIRNNTTAIQFRVKKKDKVLSDQTAPLAERVTEDVDGLLAVSEITLSLIKAKHRKRQRIVVTDVVSGVLDVFRPYLILNKVKVEHRPLPKDVYILGSRSAVECIVVNLITNAMQAMDLANTDSPTIQVMGEVRGKRAYLSVVDNGPGIRDISLNDIWQPGETTRDEGTGLGLTIVRSSVRDLNGRISAEATSELGGARFTVILPLILKE
ncbi:sensor histidine kinase [Stenotrophomonas maltophilia]|uniref:sensor histidine kinase n=1 Tax=Stenotrophomonas maltophilia TaxID=40324 RepID=UPI001094E211|nr:sensor histidine kinase [Stenotrophomonas maltophilia]TGW15931.1 sensor histidine kinase [Stenotrophomonas maltophilia]